MYVPNPLGRCPLVLRDSNIDNYKNGELLIDYDKYDIYYINYQTGEKVSITRDIYNKIVDAIAQNTKFIVQENEIDPLERKVNKFYFMIKNKEAI